MPLVNIHFPITMPPELRFEVKDNTEISLFGRRVTLLGTSSVQIHDVPEEDVEGLISRIRSALPWTWVQLDHGFLSSTHPQTVNLQPGSVATPGQENLEIKRSTEARFAGQYPTIYPTGVVPDPIWAQITLTENQPFDKFIASLEEGSKTPPLTANIAAALDLFSSIEYEISNSSKFVLLMTAFELVIDRVERAAPALASLDHGGRVLHIGSFSKTISPALRLGFLVVPPELAQRFGDVAACLAPAPAAPVQCAVAELLRDGHYLRHLRRMKRLYAARREALLRCLGEVASDSMKVEATAGLGVVTLLPKSASDVDIALRALPFGLAPSPLSRWCMQSPPQQGLLLGVTNLDERRLAADCRRLVELAR